MTVKLRNLTKDIMILNDIIIAQDFFSRLKGLLGKKSLEKDQGLILRPCNSVHTVGMKFSIDVVFVNKDNKVLHIIKNMKPYKFSPIIKKASYVIETSRGTISDENLEVGDIIEIKR